MGTDTLTYAKQIWVDHDPAYPVSAARMGVIEQGIYNASLAAPAYGTSLPAAPVDGQEAILVDSLTAPTYQWRFRYHAGSSSAYKWEFIGGAPVISAVETDETIVGASGAVDLATVGPQFTVPRAGDYFVQSTVDVYHSAASSGAYATVSAASLTIFVPIAIANAGLTLSSFVRTNGLAAGALLKMQYANQSAGTAHFRMRRLAVTPVRVS